MSKKDPFSLLGLAPEFALDEAQLHANYLALQQKLHPDAVAKLSQAERTYALQLSMDVNEAYHLLKAPLRRAQALLALNGVMVNSEKDTVKPSHELLMEVMEWREAVEDTPTPEACATQEAAFHVIHSAASEELKAAFMKKDFEAAAQVTLRLHYLEKTLAELRTRRKGLSQRSA